MKACCDPQDSNAFDASSAERGCSVGSSGCGCGESPLAGVLINEDPRIQTPPLPAGYPPAPHAAPPYEPMSLIPLNLAPDTPPPKSL